MAVGHQNWLYFTLPPRTRWYSTLWVNIFQLVNIYFYTSYHENNFYVKIFPQLAPIKTRPGQFSSVEKLTELSISPPLFKIISPIAFRRINGLSIYLSIYNQSLQLNIYMKLWILQTASSKISFWHTRVRWMEVSAKTWRSEFYWYKNIFKNRFKN